MIIEKIGNVLDIPHGVIVHGCNSHGVMGSGIAKKIRERHSEVFDVYYEEYTKGVIAGRPCLQLGSYTYCLISPTHVIVNAVTQQNFGRNPGIVYVDYDALALAFKMMTTSDSDIRKIGLMYGIHFPLIGCGLANGEWDIVSSLIDQNVSDEFEKTVWMLS